MKPWENKVDLLIAPVTVDIEDTDQGLFTSGNAIEFPENYSQCQPSAYIFELLELKKVRSSKETAVHLPLRLESSAHTLTSERQNSLELAAKLADELGRSGIIGFYAFADIGSIEDADPSKLYIHHSNPPWIVRAEETLEPLCEELINRGESQLNTSNFRMINGTALRSSNGTGKASPLRGYIFNRKAVNDDERIEFPNMPSCEVYMAAAALEQSVLASQTIRIIPWSMKDREITARNILRYSTGQDKFNITSVVVSSEGDVQKVLPWGDTGSTIKTVLSDLKAHKVSRAESKKLRDNASSQHKKLYEAKCYPEAEGSIPPAQIIEFPMLTQRLHEFQSRSLPAAILFDTERDKTIDQPTAIRMLYDVFTSFGVVVSKKQKSLAATQRSSTGYRTNDVTITEIKLASKKENPDPSITTNYISLIVKIIHEQLDQQTKKQLLLCKSPEEVSLLLEKSSARSMLIEAVRHD